MTTLAYIPVENDDSGESVANAVFTSLDGAIGWLTTKSMRAGLRPSTKIEKRTRTHSRWVSVTTVETPDWKLGYVIAVPLRQ